MSRYIVFGAGAIGGVLGAHLTVAGVEVLLVARGKHGRVIREQGLRIDQPSGSTTLRIPAVEALGANTLRGEDVVLLTTKSQDTAAALDQLSAAGDPGVPIVCAQNGIANEPAALRRFEHVYAMVVVFPATHLEPGVVVAPAAPIHGVLDLGRYPSGTDELTASIAKDLETAGYLSMELSDAMAWKRTKLLGNLANVLQALVGPESETADVLELARAEARACFTAAGLSFVDEGKFAARSTPVRSQGIDWRKRGGGSSWQSMARGLPSIESDYLNGEIVLLGRLHNVPTPINALLQRLASEAARARSGPSSLTADELRALVVQATG